MHIIFDTRIRFASKAVPLPRELTPIALWVSFIQQIFKVYLLQFFLELPYGMSQEEATMKIWGDSRSGNCLKVKFTCDYLALPYEWIELDVMSGQTGQKDFLKINPMGQVPVIKLEDGRTLAQSNAIILFLARDSGLIPEIPFSEALMNQWLFWEQYSHETSIAVRRFQKTFLKKSDDEIDVSLMVKGNVALDLMEKHLSGQNYFVGNKLSLADIALVAYTRWAGEGGFSLSDRPQVIDWVARVSLDLNI